MCAKIVSSAASPFLTTTEDNNGWDQEGPRQGIFVMFEKESYGAIAALIGKVKEMYCGIERQGENGKTFSVLMDHVNY